jgi:hypothetical protein
MMANKKEGRAIPLNEFARELLDGFAQWPGVTETHSRHLLETFSGSPALTERFNEAANRGQVRSIELSETSAAASYVLRRCRLLIDKDELGRDFDRHKLTFVLGHELQHAADRAIDRDQQNELKDEVYRISHSDGVHDYTDSTRTAIVNTRWHEGRAEIGGWNALVDAVRHENGRPDLKSVYQACPGYSDDFVDIDSRNMASSEAYRLKSGIQVDADLRMPMTEGNIEAMARHYADRDLAPGLGFGRQQSADYRHQAATQHLNMAIAYGDYGIRNDHGLTHPLRIDLAGLGLSRRRMQEYGVDLGGGRLPLPIHDQSRGQVEVKYFEHSAEVHYENASIRRPTPPILRARQPPPPMENSKHSASANMKEQSTVQLVARRARDDRARKR